MNELSILRGLLLRDRSVRRFTQKPVSVELLKEIVGLVRYCASGANRQPLVYMIATDKEIVDRLYPALKWAGYYEDWDGPAPGERPVAYIVQALDTKIAANPMCDDGIQLQAVTLGATALGLGACIIKSFSPQAVKEIFDLPEDIKPLYVVALGYPAERTAVVDQKDRSDIKYYRDADDCQCVPKRPLESIILSIDKHGL